jgi:hypothetical protein
MEIVSRIKSLFKIQQNYFLDNLMLEKNGKAVKNVNVRYNKHKKWHGIIVANNLNITDYDLFTLQTKMKSGYIVPIRIMVKKTLFGKIVFEAVNRV